MFKFENIEHLWALAAIPVLVLVFIGMWQLRKKALQNFGDASLISRLMPEGSTYKHFVKMTLLTFAFLALAIAWANPQWGLKKEKLVRRSSDVIIALDVSNSMLAQDTRPTRLEKAKNFTLQLIQRLKGERIGLIIFAGNAYLQTPLTTDYAAAQLFVKSAGPQLVPVQGTALKDVIELAEKSFSTESKNNKALIIITDGEDHEEGMMEAAQTASDNGLLIFTIGVGTEKGGAIPIYANGRAQFKTDRNGNTVYSKLNENMLKELSATGRGQYFHVNAGENIFPALTARIAQLEKEESEQDSFSDYESYFQWFLALSLLLLMAEFLLSFRKNNWLADRKLFD